MNTIQNRISDQIQQAISNLNEAARLPFSDWLPAEEIQKVLTELGIDFRERVYTPFVTLWAFLSQALSPDASCRDAVARVRAWLAAQGEKVCSANTGSYCEARQRLPEELPARLAHHVAQTLEQQAPESWRWKGRHVKVVDGSTVSMPDEEKNQQAFPQSSGQKPGLGFPVARIVMLFSLATGAALEWAMAACSGKKTGENTLFRDMDSALNPGDIVLGDRNFESYHDVTRLLQRGVDGLFRMNSTRHYDFRRGHWLAQDDHLVQWKKPKFDATRFDRETYHALPETLLIREVRFHVTQAGFRTESVVLVTTLLDAELYPAEDLASLYRARWHAELDLNALKTTLQMEILRGKTPEMVRKEFTVHVLAYNLIRRVMAEAARVHDQQPRHLSFKAAVQTITAFAPYLTVCAPHRHHAILVELLKGIASQTVGDRLDRSEPRAIKRRNGKYPYMTKPRPKQRQRSAA